MTVQEHIERLTELPIGSPQWQIEMQDVVVALATENKTLREQIRQADSALLQAA